jgi:hypothetical protein
VESYPEHLTDKIMIRIAIAERRRLLFFRIPFASIMTITAILVLFPAFKELRNEVVLSGFAQFVSLFISDSSVALANWKDFGMLLLESLPTFGLTAVLVICFSLLASMRSLVHDLSTLKPIQNGI